MIKLQSVSPKEEYEILGLDEENEEERIEVEVDDSGIEGERLSIDKEEEVVKKVKDPKLPTQEEVDKHYIKGHLPYRDWCPICIKAQGRDMGNRRGDNKERMLPEYSWDYSFPGNELGVKWSVFVGERKGIEECYGDHSSE